MARVTFTGGKDTIVAFQQDAGPALLAAIMPGQGVRLYMDGDYEEMVNFVGTVLAMAYDAGLLEDAVQIAGEHIKLSTGRFEDGAGNRVDIGDDDVN